MAKIDLSKGADKYLKQLEQLSSKSDEMIKRAIYPAAGIVADRIRAETESLPTSSNEYGSTTSPIDGVTKTQKEGLLNGLGIAPFQKLYGFINVKVGFDGYNKTKTKKYPNGQPNALIARSVNSGTSFRVKNTFVDRAVRSSRKKAETAMAEEFDKEVSKIMKG